MKTESQIEEKLEACVKKIGELTSSVEGEPTQEQLASIMHMTGWLFCIGWMIDCEDELRQMIAPFKIAAALQQVDGVISDKKPAKKKGK